MTRLTMLLGAALALACAASEVRADEYFVLRSEAGPLPYTCGAVESVSYGYAGPVAYEPLPYAPAYALPAYPAYSRYALRGPAYYGYSFDPLFVGGVGGYGVRTVFNDGNYAEVGRSGGAAFARNGSFAVSTGNTNFAFTSPGGTAFAGGGGRNASFSSTGGGQSLAFSQRRGGGQSFAFSGGGESIAFSDGGRRNNAVAFAASSGKMKGNVAFAARNGTAFARSGRNIAFAR